MQALIAQRRVRTAITSNTYEGLCPAIRIPQIMDVKAVQEVPGGWTEASFTIPAAHRRYGLESMPHSVLFLPVWIMDGLSRVFHGVVSKVIPNDQGDLEVTCDGSYRLLGETRMRVVWSDVDMTKLVQAPGSAGGAAMTIDGQGRLVFTFPKDHSFTNGSYIAADYFLFGESVGTRDTKGIDSWKITLGAASSWVNATSVMEVRIYGMGDPGDTSPYLLHTFNSVGTRMETSDAVHGGDNGSAWPFTRFRCIRVGLYASAAIAASASDHNAIITNFAVSTQGRHDVGLNPPAPSTSAIAKDVWGGGQSYDLHAYAVEEEPSGTGLSVVGNIADSGQKAYGMAFTDWSSPQEVVEANAALDGYIVGMWGPTRNYPAGSHVIKTGNTSVNAWYRQPAELTYKAWNDLSDPDYHVRLGAGAVWQPDGQPDDLVSADYVTFNSLRGRALSTFTEDASQDNMTYEQGLHVASDYAIDPAIDGQTATTLGLTYTQQRRQPALSGTLTLYGDRPKSWELPGGARGPRLYEFRPGVVRVVDAKGAKAGRITRLEYTARTASSPETLVLTINNPADSLLNLQTARLARRAAHNRHR